VKGQKKEILTRQESRPDVFYFLPTAHSFKHLPTHNGTFAFAPTHKANPSAKSKEPFFANAYFKVYEFKIIKHC